MGGWLRGGFEGWKERGGGMRVFKDAFFGKIQSERNGECKRFLVCIIRVMEIECFRYM